MVRPHPKTSAQVKQAREDGVTYYIPRIARDKFCDQIRSCRRRGIEMEFTLKEWWDWWQQDGRWEKRGLHSGGFVMCRLSDEGPYSLDNVFCGTTKENAKDANGFCSSRHRERRRAGWRDAMMKKRRDPNYRHHLAVRGFGHPQSKPLITPKGIFGSAELAAEANGYSGRHARRLARKDASGWGYYHGEPPESAMTDK